MATQQQQQQHDDGNYNNGNGNSNGNGNDEEVSKKIIHIEKKRIRENNRKNLKKNMIR